MGGQGAQTLFITGATGFIGAYVARAAAAAGWDVIASFRGDAPPADGTVHWVRADITRPDDVRRAIEEAAPRAVIHLAAISKIDLCETEREFAHSVNVGGTIAVAEGAASAGARLISISSDNVFDGRRALSTEDDAAEPVNYYGRTKLLAEGEALRRNPDTVAVRIPLTLGFALNDARPFFNGVVGMLRQGKDIWFTTDEYRSPCDAASLADTLLELAGAEYCGVLHVAGAERSSPADMGRALFARLGVPEDRAKYIRQADIGQNRAPRPLDISMDVSRAQSMLSTPLPDLAASMERIWRSLDPHTIDLTQTT